MRKGLETSYKVIRIYMYFLYGLPVHLSCAGDHKLEVIFIETAFHIDIA